jgi:hypothetical protein
MMRVSGYAEQAIVTFVFCIQIPPYNYVQFWLLGKILKPIAVRRYLDLARLRQAGQG